LSGVRRFLLCLVFFAAGCKTDKPAPPPLPTVRVEVWHDTVCPWCRIGLHNLQAVKTELAPKVNVEIVLHPFLLNPDAPPEGKSLREHLGERYGDDRIEEMFSRVSQFGAQYGVQFRWDLVTVMPNTAASHALLESAPAEKKQAVLEALHRAYFEEGKNIGDAEVLAAIARSAGVDATTASADRLAAIRSAADSASSQGISGVPFFVIGGQGYNGAQPPEKLKAAIMQATAR
jgi:predicted DsbA family dithiol-disulfide isomerase